jgi:predicted O-methyltransferase YrrM
MRDQHSSEGLLDLIKELGDVSDKTMVEIGSFIGESTIIFAKHFKHVTAIDPFLPDYDPQDPTCNSGFNFEEVFQEFKDRIEEEKDKVTIIRMKSDDAVPLLKDKYDFIYIDGLHTYFGVRMDILDYLPLVKEGGVIGGHDYGTSHPHLQGVTKAVDEVLGKPDKTFKDGSWIKFL